MCPMCRFLLATPEGQHLAAALREGIVILVMAPFAAFGTIAYFAVKSQRRLGEMRKREILDSPTRG